LLDSYQDRGGVADDVKNLIFAASVAQFMTAR
jgi:hypothetical protein